MADPVEGLPNLVVREIESICCRLRYPTAVLDVQEALENIDQIVYGVNCLDSVTRLPDDVYRDMSSAKRIIENASSTSARTPRIITNMPGRPAYDLNEDQLRSLIYLRFTVPQISELLHVSTRTIERRLAEYVISARSFSTLTDEELDSVVMEIKTFHPNCGSKSLAGYLASRNVKVPKCIDIVGKLLRFVDQSSEEGVAEFLKFSTGCSTPPLSGIHQILVEISSWASAIFASTCLLKLVLPESLAETAYEEFHASLSSVMYSKGSVFGAP